MTYINEFFSAVFFSIFSCFLLIILQLKYHFHLYEFFKHCVCMIMLIILLTVTLFPVPIGSDSIEMTPYYNAFNFIPFRTIYSYILDALHGTYQGLVLEVFGNILLFIMVSMVINWFLTSLTFKKSLIICLFLSIMIEAIQGIIGLILNNFYRSVDIDDIILSTIGGIIGYYLYKIFSSSRKSKSNS